MQYHYRLTFFAIFFFAALLADAQTPAKAPYSFLKLGNIPKEHLEMTKYGQDTSASAVILYDAGKSYFSPSSSRGLSLTFERHTVIKILKKSGYDWADVEIKLYRNSNSEKEALTNLKAFTYNMADGKMVNQKLTKESIFEEKNTENWTTQKFTMPNVKEGSVIEFSYKIESPFFFNFQEWTFQQSIPTLWTEYTATIPEYFYYKKIAQGYEPYYINEAKPVNINWSAFNLHPSGTDFHWVMKDVPALKREPFMSSVNNFVSKIEFELGKFQIPGQVYESYNNTWEKVAANLLASEHFGTQITRTGFAKEAVTPLVAKAADDGKKMLAIFDYVKQNIKYNDHERVFTEHNLRKALETKSGGAADVNLLLVAMLKEAGLKANPVILSTRDNGLVSSMTYPSISKFNYVIGHVQIGEKEYLLDATEPFSLPNMLPVRCLNGEGRLISKEQSKWITLTPTTKGNEFYQATLAIGTDNSLKGKVQVQCSGYMALDRRKEILGEGEKKYIEKLRNKANHWEIEKFNILNASSPAEALKMDYEVNLSGQSQAVNTIYLSPLQDQAQKTNPFKLENRKFPVDFATPLEETYMFTYTIPAGYKVEEQPKNAIISLPENGGRFTYSITTMNNTINVLSKVSINRPVFFAEEYPYLKEFFNQLIAKQAEQIVLKKVN